MKTLTREQVEAWAAAAGLHATTTRRSSNESSDDATQSTVDSTTKAFGFPAEKPELGWRLSLPAKPYQVAYLAKTLLPYSEGKFQTCLIWITDFGFWSQDSERVVQSLVASFRAERGEARPLIETPGHVFDKSEEVDAQILLTLAMMFGWDCYVVPQQGDYYALSSHDEYLEVVPRDTASRARLERKIKRWV